MDQNSVKRIRIVLDTGEDVKISDPRFFMEDTDNMILSVHYSCTYYDAFGEHVVTKKSVFNLDHVVYFQVDYKED